MGTMAMACIGPLARRYHIAEQVICQTYPSGSHLRGVSHMAHLDTNVAAMPAAVCEAGGRGVASIAKACTYLRQ